MPQSVKHKHNSRTKKSTVMETLSFKNCFLLYLIEQIASDRCYLGLKQASLEKPNLSFSETQKFNLHKYPSTFLDWLEHHPGYEFYEVCFKEQIEEVLSVIVDVLLVDNTTEFNECISRHPQRELNQDTKEKLRIVQKDL